MQDEGIDDEVRARFSRIIHDETLRLTRLLDDLLDLSVLEHGRVTLHEGEAVLCDVLDRALRAAGAQAGDGQLKIIRDRQTEAVTLWTDADRLTQVFINLISNAQKYCDAAQPEMVISVRQLPGRIQVDFIDNGSGIPARQQALIFEKFARADTARGAPGAGLGLAISREIMLRLGGGLSYVAADHGTRFRVRLPLRVPRAA
jgi:signal transduction histidine kinase